MHSQITYIGIFNKHYGYEYILFGIILTKLWLIHFIRAFKNKIYILFHT